MNPNEPAARKAFPLFDALSPKALMLIYFITACGIQFFYWVLPMWKLGWSGGIMGLKGAFSFDGAPVTALFSMLMTAAIAVAIVFAFTKKQIVWWLPTAAFGSLTVALAAMPYFPISFLGYFLWFICASWAAFAFLARDREVKL